MSPVHFRKLMRIAVIIIAVAFLFSFFGWYLLFASSKQNKRMVEIISIADNQHVLTQRISNTAFLLLLNTELSECASADTHQKLTTAISLFEKQQNSLLLSLNQEDINRKARSMQLSNDVNINTSGFINKVKEINAADHSLLVSNNTAYTGAIRLKETKLLEALESINNIYIPQIIEKENNKEVLNTSKFISLLIA